MILWKVLNWAAFYSEIWRFVSENPKRNLSATFLNVPMAQKLLSGPFHSLETILLPFIGRFGFLCKNFALKFEFFGSLIGKFSKKSILARFFTSKCKFFVGFWLKLLYVHNQPRIFKNFLQKMSINSSSFPFTKPPDNPYTAIEQFQIQTLRTIHRNVIFYI